MLIIWRTRKAVTKRTVFFTDEGFFTMKGYGVTEDNGLTASEEDYLEMICRMSEESGFARVNDLAAKLHVKPSSASKMVVNLKDKELVEYEKYGYVKPSGKGSEIGKYLLYRHEVIKNFLSALNSSAPDISEIEGIEHFIGKKTLLNLKKITDVLLKTENK